MALLGVMQISYAQEKEGCMLNNRISLNRNLLWKKEYLD
jgi:hypothetical protein